MTIGLPLGEDSDNQTINRCLRDVVALSTLPAIWSGAEPLQVAESLAASLFNTLNPEFVYVYFSGGSNMAPVAVAQTGRNETSAFVAEQIGSPIVAWARDRDPDEPMLLRSPLGSGMLRVVTRSLGLHTELGVIAVAFGKECTPAAVHNPILDVAASQAVAAIRNAGLMCSLRESERRFREMIDALPVAIYTTDAQGMLTHYNPAAAEFSGRKPELGTDLWCVSWKLYHSDGTPMPLDECPMAVALKEERVVRGAELIAERPDGKRVWLTPYPTPLRDRQDRIAGGINMLVDITERKQLEKKIRDSEIRYRTLFESAAVSMWEEDFSAVKKDIDEVKATGVTDFRAYLDSHPEFVTQCAEKVRLLDVNEATLKILGASGKQELLKSLHTIFTPETWRVFSEEIVAIAENRPNLEAEAELRTLDGKTIDVLCTIAFPSEDPTLSRVSVTLIDITGRKAEEQTRARLAAIVESSADAIISKDLDGIIQTWNSGAERLFGYTAEEAIGQPVTMLIPSERIEEEPSILARISRGERLEDYETIRRRKDGTLVHISLTVSPIVGESGHMIGASKIVRDITERKQSDEALRASEERFRAIFSGVVSGIAQTDMTGRFVMVNDRYCEITGRRREELLNLRMQDITHPNDLQGNAALFERLLKRGESFEIEKRYIRPDGSLVWVHNSVSGIRDAQGRLQYAVADVVEITDRKRAEEERERARQTAELLNRVGSAINKELDTQTLTQRITDIATAVTEAQFGAFFYNVLDDQGESYLLYTLSGATLEAFSKFPNPRNTAVFGRTFRGEGVVRSPDITKDPRYGRNSPYHGMPEGHLPVRSYLAAPVVSRSGEVLGGLFFGHENTEVFTEQHEKIIEGIAGQAAIALDNARLFTKVKRNQEELSRANAELRRANADLEQFAYSASHDLQEPIRNVAIFGDILNRRYGHLFDEKARECLAFMTGGARRMEMLVKDLLVYTRSATEEEEEARVESNVALARALSDLSESIRESGANVTYNGLPSLAVREIHLQQIFQNLIGNAIKYRRDGDKPSIEITANRQGGEWLITVRDNGLGIAPEYKDKVFGIFKRLHTGEKYSGTGMGLAICKRIVERYGGRIWVESEGPGKGSTFYFTLPAAEHGGSTDVEPGRLDGSGRPQRI